MQSESIPDLASDDCSAHAPGSLLGSLAVRAAARQRQRLYRIFLDESQARSTDRVLDLGVTSDARYATNNYFESRYPYTARITAAGLSDESYLPQRHPGLTYVRIDAGRHLPFASRSFDLVHSSAVIEHAGSRELQTFFLEEAWRVCRRVLFITTPNRWFPVEVHTGLPLVHWLSARHFRACLKAFGLRAWADEARLNLLTARDLSLMARTAGLANIRVRGVRLAGFTSNLALVARRDSPEIN